MRRPLTAVVLTAAVAPAALWLMTPAVAAVTPACSSKSVNTKTCVVVWSSDSLTPATMKLQAGASVIWHNGNTNIIEGTVELQSAHGAPTTFDVSAGPGTSTKPLRFSRVGTEKYTGSDTLKSGVPGTITVVAAPTSSPPSPPPRSSPPTPPSHPPAPPPPGGGGGTSNPPPPAPAPLGVTNPPPLGVGVLPTPAPSLPGPNPLVATPNLGIPTTPTPTAVPADVPKALGQSVPARKYGLPGALAAVLLAGLVVGVVRAARAEANGHAAPETPQPPG
ncbi:MAG: hypothetical protein ACJ735_09105 [Actinomycetes bacterium]